MGSWSRRRDDDAEQRDQDAQARDLTDEQRDRLARQRDQSADQRDLNGEQRDLDGEQRDLDAQQRDLDAAQRDREAGRRDLEADQRDQEAELSDGTDVKPTTAANWETQRRSTLRRQEAALDRRNASRDRTEAASERDRARLDRGTALADRVAGASGRDSAGLDRDTAMDDRAASATDRHYASQLATSLYFGWTVHQLDPPELLYVSPGYLRILGLPQSRSDITLTQVLAMVHPDDVDHLSDSLSDAANPGVTVEAEVRMLRADGETRWIRTVSSPVTDGDGSITRGATTVEDVTDRKRGEASLRLAQQNAERANAAKSDFLSRMSHELRTPLNAVLGFAQLLALDPLSPSQVTAVDHILLGGRHLLAMIEDVLDMSRIDTGRLAVTLESVHITDLLDEVIGVMAPIAAVGGVNIAREPVPPGTVHHVLADRHRLRQVLLQLVSNAIKYNRPSGQVDIRCVRDLNSDNVQVSVTDTGCGIQPEELPRLFIPFERMTLKRSDIEGTGIGLALSFRLMAIMGGRIEVQSEFGSGSTFSVTMPLTEAPGREPRSRALSADAVE